MSDFPLGEMFGFVMVLMIFAPLYQYLPLWGVVTFVSIMSVLFIHFINRKVEK